MDGHLNAPGTAVLEFLDPIAHGMNTHAFLDLLRDLIETRSEQLVAEATGEPFAPTVLVAG